MIPANLAFLAVHTYRQVAVLTGDGEHFSSGLDLAALREGQLEKVHDTFASWLAWPQTVE